MRHSVVNRLARQGLARRAGVESPSVREVRHGCEQTAPIKYPPDENLARLFARVMEIAKRLPGVVESRSYGTPSIKVKRRVLARLRSEAEGGLAIHCDFMDREMLLQAAPETFYITEHYAGYPMVLINLKTVLWDAMLGIVERGWRLVATPGLVKEFEARSGG